MSYSKFDIEKVRKAADIRDFIPNLHGTGATRYTECPKCGKGGKNRGLLVTHKGDKDIAKCFSCGHLINGAIAAVEEYENKPFPEALKIVAEQYGIILQTDNEKKTTSVKKTRLLAGNNSFVAQQLKSSGLTFDDVTAQVKDPVSNAIIHQPTFIRGGCDKFFNLQPNDDEMLILYYNLWGARVQYATKGAAGRLRDYFRVRWSNPDLHKDSDGRPIKYQTPKGASTQFYIPQYIRTRFQGSKHIETLIIQEGEKKSEKACKHDIASIGIQGIYNIGNQESGLIKDLQYLIQTCSIKNVVLMLDSDWEDLHRNVISGDSVDQRPNQFAKAVIKFKQYVQTLHNIGVDIDVYFGHINENPQGDKGIDDLLTNTLTGREAELLEDINKTMYTHDGKGKFVDIHKISTKSDLQIKDYWRLNDRDGFFERHKTELLKLSSFRFSMFRYKVESGEFIQATKCGTDGDFWKVTIDDEKGKKNISVDYIELFKFLQGNGYYRIKTDDCDVDNYKFVKIDDGVVRLCGQSDIRDFVYEFARQSCKDKDVIQWLSARLGSQLGPDKLERLEMIYDNFDNFQPSVQRLYFANGALTIDGEKADFSTIHDSVWVDKVIGRKFKRVPIVKDIVKDDQGQFSVIPSAEGQNCEFFQFIQHVSNFWGESASLDGADAKEIENEFNQHVVNKMTSIGYLLVDYKYQSELKAVIAMDGQMGEVSQSNGRTGKSLVGAAISKMIDQCFVDGKGTKNDDDYIYSNVTPRTRNLFIDDVRVNFDFERFFAAITGDLAVNPKGKSRFIVKKDKSPKLLITTNHAINANNRSAQERIIYMAFSDHYNDNYRPIDDFGHSFFSDWDTEQWNLFDNFMAECVMYYFRSMDQGWYRTGQGAVPPPMHDIIQRMLRQQMGEGFLQWAETYYEPSSDHLGARLVRKDLYDAYHESFPDRRLTLTPVQFRQRLTYFCQFKGYHLNAQIPNKKKQHFAQWILDNPGESFIGEADKSASVEYFTITTTEIQKNEPF